MTQADYQLHHRLCLEYQKLIEKIDDDGRVKVWLVLEGDWGGQIYLTIPWQLVGEQPKIHTLLGEMDQLAWSCNEREGASAYFFATEEFGLTGDDGVSGGMGGGALRIGLWMHREFYGRPTFLSHLFPEGGSACEIQYNMVWENRVKELLQLGLFQQLTEETMLELVKPEFGQICFGNAFGPFDLGEYEDYVRDQMRALSKLSSQKLHPDSNDEHLGEYVEDFKNGAFEIHPYWWGFCCSAGEVLDVWEEEHPHSECCPYPNDPCSCGTSNAYGKLAAQNPHMQDCRTILPNFRCGNVEVRWYKHIGRGMSLDTDHEISGEEWQQIFEKCRQSLQ